MSFGRIIITIAIFIGITFLQKTEPKFLKFVLAGFILSFLFSFFNEDIFFNYSFLSFGILTLVYFAYSLYHKNLLSASISIFIIISFIFKAQHWPYASEIQLSMTIPIILFLVTVFSLKKYKNEIAILGIITAYAISEITYLITS